MKRILLALIPVLLFVSCDKENAGKQTVTVNATCSKAKFSMSDAISVFCGSSSAEFAAKSVESAGSARFEGRIVTSGSNRLTAVYPSLPAETLTSGVFSIANQKPGDEFTYYNASVNYPDYSAPLAMDFKPMTSKGVIAVVNKSDYQLRLTSVAADGGRLFYSKCDFVSSASMNVFSEPVITVETAGQSLPIGSTLEVPFYMFPGEVAQSKVSLTLNLTGDAGKTYQVRLRVDFARPKAGEESAMTVEIITELLDDSPKDYTIVYPKSLTGAALEGIKAIPSIIRTKTGLDVACVSDDTAETEYEILFGDTNRSVGKAVNCPGNAYIIRYKDKKLVVKGSSKDQLIAALYGLERDVLAKEEYASEGRLKFTVDLDITRENGEILAMRHMIRDLYDFTVKETLLSSFKGDSPVVVAQGACTDGTYGYYGFRDSKETRCIIYKHRLSDHVKVAQVELDLTDCSGYSHINDLVYEPDSDMIYVSAWSNAKGSPKVLLRVIASSMTQTTSVTGTTHSPTALAYNPSEKLFMSRAGTNVYVSSAGFTSSRLVNGAYKNFGYTNQGGGGDDLYCYFPVNNGTNSQLLTFDWTGRQLWNIQINNKTESESLFVVGEKYYWWCYGSSTGYLFLLTPEMRFTPNFKGGWSDVSI